MERQDGAGEGTAIRDSDKPNGKGKPNRGDREITSNPRGKLW